MDFHTKCNCVEIMNKFVINLCTTYFKSIASLNTKFLLKNKSRYLIEYYKMYRNIYNKIILKARNLFNSIKIQRFDNMVKKQH